MTTTTLHVRLDSKAQAMLDELTEHHARAAAALGVPYTRSDTVRVVLRAAYEQLRDERNATR
jgi:hypothetical protein